MWLTSIEQGGKGLHYVVMREFFRMMDILFIECGQSYKMFYLVKLTELHILCRIDIFKL